MNLLYKKKKASAFLNLYIYLIINTKKSLAPILKRILKKKIEFIFYNFNFSSF